MSLEENLTLAFQERPQFVAFVVAEIMGYVHRQLIESELSIEVAESVGQIANFSNLVNIIQTSLVDALDSDKKPEKLGISSHLKDYGKSNWSYKGYFKFNVVYLKVNIDFINHDPKDDEVVSASVTLFNEHANKGKDSTFIRKFLATYVNPKYQKFSDIALRNEDINLHAFLNNFSPSFEPRFYFQIFET